MRRPTEKRSAQYWCPTRNPERVKYSEETILESPAEVRRVQDEAGAASQSRQDDHLQSRRKRRRRVSQLQQRCRRAVATPPGVALTKTPRSPLVNPFPEPTLVCYRRRHQACHKI